MEQETTTIAVKIDTHKYLKDKKAYPEESFDKVLKRELKIEK